MPQAIPDSSYNPKAVKPNTNYLSKMEYSFRCRMELCRRHLDEYYRFITGWSTPPHIRMICEKLENLPQNGRLIISMPPRMSKSTTVTQVFPAWLMGRAATYNQAPCRIGMFTYGQSLSNELSFKARQFVASEYNHLVFQDANIESEAVQMWRVSPSKGDITYYASSVNGVATGLGYECLTEDTEVDTPNGKVTISKIKPGDIVLSFNHNTNNIEHKKVIACKKSYTKQVTELCFSDHSKIKATSNHLFYNNGIYQKVEDLVVGSILSGKHLSLTSVINYPEDIPVYDIQVEDNSNYFANDILVHNCMIIDDPHKNIEEASNMELTQKAYDWYQTTAHTRMNKGGRIIIIGTRWTEHDLIGRLKDTGEYDELTLPAINEAGEALWPSQFPLEKLQNIKSTMSAKYWNAIYQQDPLPDSGSVFRSDYIQYSKPSDIEKSIIVWDTASSIKNSADYSAAIELGISANNDIYVINIFRARLEFPELLNKVQTWGNSQHVYIEDKDSGRAVIQALKNIKHKRNIIPIQPNGGKELRAQVIIPYFEAGKVYLTDEHNSVELERELLTFPNGRHDDLVDALVYAIMHINKNTTASSYIKRDDIIKSSPYGNLF